MPRRLSSLWVVLFLTVLPVGVRADEGEDFFEKRIRPVLVERCFECHSAETDGPRGGLRLDDRDGLLKGGDSGPPIVPGKPDESLLIEALRYDSLAMPPDGQLSKTVIADFVKWIELGAPNPREPAVVETPPSEIDIAQGRQWWSFQPPRRSEAPSNPQSALRTPHSKLRTPLDAFIVARLEEKGLSPSPPADRRTLIRRVTFDLTGLPPTPEDVAAFINDASPDAYDRLVDRLLASPAFGERWARPWLDLARYAEDQAHIVGDDTSLCYPNAYLYRDWVIEALNADVPYDRFVKLQLAADVLEPDDTSNHAALGFIGLGPKYYRRNAPEVMADEWEDRVDVVTRGLLGLTVACARCHDHKFD
ncbi:MAG: DUF1549 domain-containing protein, partial [Planctomycetaceae bacterium]